MDRLLLIIIAAIIVFSFITFILHKVFNRKKYLKYILPLFISLPTLYNFYQASIPSEGFSDLGSFLMAFILSICLLSSLVTGLFLDFILPKLKADKKIP